MKRLSATIPSRIFFLPFSSKNLKIKRCRTPIFHLYVCESWSVTLREEDNLRVFENRVLRKGEEVTGN
jgi:hypothetical protein